MIFIYLIKLDFVVSQQNIKSDGQLERLPLHYLHHLTICANFKQQKYLLIIQCCMLGFILHIDEYISICLTFELSDIVAGLTFDFICEAGIKVVLQSPPFFFFFTLNLKRRCSGQSGEKLHHKFDQWSKHNWTSSPCSLYNQKITL